MALPDDAPTVLCIPARDEAAMLPGLLAAIAGQSVPLTTLRVCIYLDDCRDGSAHLLERIGPDLPFPLIVAQGPCASAPNAGAARRAALAPGCGPEGGGFVPSALGTREQ